MKRSWLLYSFILGSTVLFIGRLFFIQFLDQSYSLNAVNNSKRIVKVYAPRGIIKDRNGKILASNQVAYDIEVIPNQISDLDTLKLGACLGQEIDALKKSLTKAQHYSPFKPSPILQGLTSNDFAAIQEELSFFSGIELRRRTLRKYPTKNAGNILGYVSEVNEYLLNKKPTYELGDYIGISGIEASYEEELKGQEGRRFITVDHLNRDVGPLENGRFDKKPTPGSDLTLTIDAELQAYGQLLMRGKRGSIVAIEPSTGEVLTIVSAPSYDPNSLVGRHRSRNYNLLYRDSVNKPLFDRGILAEYPPGSPFKVVNALIALEEGVVDPTTKYTCRDGFHFGKLHIGCHCRSGTLDLRESIAKSCNNYHCQIFKKTIEKYPTAYDGLQHWQKHVKSFGLGNYLGVDLPTGRKGFVPDANFYNGIYQKGGWKAPTVISLAIGQGELLVTPIQLANLAATIANRGYWYTPHVVRSIEDRPVDPEKYQFKHITTIDPSHYDVVISGMLDVFERGTAKASKLKGLPMAGKTGTAENPHGQDHSIFMAFAPVENPKIAIAIIVENGYWGSRWAAPIASLMMEKFITGKVTRPELEASMVEGNLLEEYGVLNVETTLPSN